MPHKFIKADIPPADNQVIETCLVCGEKRVRYRSGSKAYFDKVTGSKMPYVTACIPKFMERHFSKGERPEDKRPAKIVSIPVFVKADQNNGSEIDLRARFIECLVMLQSVYELGMTEKVKNMVGRFLKSQERKQIEEFLIAK